MLNLIPEQVRDYVIVAPFIFTVLICISTGAGLHRWQKFPSALIPLTLAPIGALTYALIAWGMDQDYRSTLWAQNGAVGALIGFSATGIHQMIENSPVLSKFPILKLLVPAPEAESKPTEEPNT